MLINAYYLLYKLKNCEILWIVDIVEDYKSLKNRIKDAYLTDDQYYIVRKKIHEEDLYKKCKQFIRFQYNHNCELIYHTK
jgi:hypothetical protein